MKKKILVVENDYLQYEWIYDSLKSSFSFFASYDIERIRTEREFVKNFNNIAEDPPEIIIMDAMLQWTLPSEELEQEKPPKEVLAEGHQSAGLRCERRLADDSRTSSIPVIIYTVLERADLEEKLNDLPPHVKHLRKESDPGNLLQQIREAMGRRQTSA
jgi:CheY-like chemotaxis protein